MTTPREMYADSCNALWALSALRVAVEHGLFASLVDAPRDARTLADAARLDGAIVGRVLDVLVAYGLLAREGESYALTDQGRTLARRADGLLADIAVTFGQTHALVEDARRGTLGAGWRHVDPEVIRSQAKLSLEMNVKMAKPLRESWPELASLLGRDGAVLVDIGVGGAGGAIGMCQVYPKLRVVGIDPLPAALTVARSNVAANGLGDRIELRAQRGDELHDVRAFDAAFLPATFLDDRALEATLTTLRTALKEGGALMTAGWRDVGEARASAVSRLRTELWGAGPRTAETVTTMLERAGFRNPRLGPGAGDMVAIVAWL